MQMEGGVNNRRLALVSEGVFSVAEVCRILQPTMTARKVHYWLDTGLLSDPVRWGGPGRPTLLNFKQLLQIRTVQHLRDELQFSLPKVRAAFEWILTHLFDEASEGLRFERGPNGSLVAVTGTGEAMTVPGGQGVMPIALSEHAQETRFAWERQAYIIPGKPDLVANPRVFGGAPVVNGTRIETALLASFADDETFDDDLIKSLNRQFPTVTHSAARQALEFEGLRAAA